MTRSLASFLLLALCLAQLNLAAPLKSITAKSINLDNVFENPVKIDGLDSKKSQRTKVFRFDLNALMQRSNVNVKTEAQYILDESIGLSDAKAELDSVPVFPEGGATDSHNKKIIVDTNGELLTITYGGHKFIPVWARPWTSNGFHGALRFSQGLAMGILFCSLGLSLVFSYWTSLCPKKDVMINIELGQSESVQPRIEIVDTITSQNGSFKE